MDASSRGIMPAMVRQSLAHCAPLSPLPIPAERLPALREDAARQLGRLLDRSLDFCAVQNAQTIADGRNL